MKRTCLFFTVLFLLSGCGPEESSQDLYNQQIATIVATQKAQLTPFVGKYVGLLTKSTGGTEPVEVDLVMMSVLAPDPSQDQNSEVPTLGGSINICATDVPAQDLSALGEQNAVQKKSSKAGSQKSKSSTNALSCLQPGSSSTSSTVPMAMFTGSMYNQQTNILSLYSSASSSGANSGLTGFQVHLDGTIVGDHFTGTFYTSLNPDVGTIDVTREH